MDIKRITVIQGNGVDHVILHTRLLEATWPYTGNLTLTFTTAKGSGEEYAKKYWPGVDVEVIT